jgi:hypothetical protein
MTNNNILIGAEGVDGANFLACCLSMSDQVYFNGCDISEKIKFFFTEMSKIENMNGLPIWSDVSMLFYNCARAKTKVLLAINQSKKNYELFQSTLKDKTLISKVQLPLFWPLTTMMAKNPEDPLVKLFESKYFIGLVNPDLFISLRTVLGDSDLDSFTIEEFNLLSKNKQTRIKNKYKTDLERLFKIDNVPSAGAESIPETLHKWNMHYMKCNAFYLENLYPENRSYDSHKKNSGVEYLYSINNELIKNKITHQWDCNWFLTEDETIKNIKFLYSDMNLGECNEELIRKMYRAWVYRMDYIKKSHINEFRIKHKRT